MWCGWVLMIIEPLLSCCHATMLLNISSCQVDFLMSIGVCEWIRVSIGKP